MVTTSERLRLIDAWLVAMPRDKAAWFAIEPRGQEVMPASDYHSLTSLYDLLEVRNDYASSKVTASEVKGH